MKTSSYRDTRAEVRLDDIRYNVAQFKALLKPGVRFMAVVKADGYGHGAALVARAALAAGATDLGVALLDEALELVESGIRAPILILGHTPVRSLEMAIDHGIGITVFDELTLREAIAYASRLGRTARLHVKVDTGMTRLGVSTPEELVRLVKLAHSSAAIELEGVFTHFADADGESEAYTREQFVRFSAMLAALEREGLRVPVRHCCNSAATARYPDMHLDMVRVGIGIYGLLADWLAKPLHLKPAMSFVTKVTHLLRVPEGSSVGYGRTFFARRDSVIATLPVGYADGYSRQLSNNGRVSIGGRTAQVVGRICMDQTMIDVTDLEEVRVGDDALLFGDALDEGISVFDIARSMRSIPHDVLCHVGARVPRMYSEG